MENDILIAWMKEVSGKVEHVETALANKIDDGIAQLHRKHNLLREEFIIHKTASDTKSKIATRRSALISTAIALAIALASLIYTVASREQDNKIDYMQNQEITDIKNS